MTGIFFDIDDTLYSRRALLLRAARETVADPVLVCGEERAGEEGSRGKGSVEEGSVEEGSDKEDEFIRLFYMYGDMNYPQVVAGQISPFESNVWRFVKTVRHLGFPASQEDGQAFAARYTFLQEHMTMSEELHGKLQELSAKPGLRLGVITNGASQFQWKKYDMLGLDRYIPRENVVVSGDIGISKPERGIFLEAQERMHLQPADLWIAGDSVKHDILGAKACGWHTLWLRRKGENPEGVETDLRADNETEMCRLLSGL